MTSSTSAEKKTPTATTTPSSGPSFVIGSPQHDAQYLKLLVYGKYGCGKTTLAGTACEVPEMRDVLMLDAEAGSLSLTMPEYVDSIRVSDYKQVARILDYLRLHCKARDENDNDKLLELERKVRPGQDIKEPRRYKTLIMDSLTEVEAFCMYHLLGITDRTKLDAEVVSPEWAEYKRNYNMIQRMIRSYRDLPMHIIFTCPQQYVQDNQKRFFYTPFLTGKLSSEIQGFMDMVGYLTVETSDDGKKKRRLYVNPISRFDAKHRFAVFKNDWFEEPTINKIVRECQIRLA